MPTCAIFADTKDEPKSVYNWLDWLETKLPFRVYRVTAGSLSAAALKMSHNLKTGKPYYSNKIPAFVKGGEGQAEGKVSRYCTRDHKIYPILRCVKKLAVKEIHDFRSKRFGMKPSRDDWCLHRFPLIEKEMRRDDCIRWMEEHGFPKPPRSACRYCPYKSDHEWRLLRNIEPEEFAMAVKFEKDLQEFHAAAPIGTGKVRGTPFLHRSLKPLDQVDFSTDVQRGQGLLAGFGNECEGMCGL